jgi:hypothetical protein
MKRKFQLVLAITLACASCKKKDSGKLTPTCDGSHPTYTGQISGIISSNCNSSGCHGAGSNKGDFTSFSGLQPYLNNGSFKREVLTNQTMPQGSASLSQSQINLVQCWVNDGYPQN